MDDAPQATEYGSAEIAGPAGPAGTVEPTNRTPAPPDGGIAETVRWATTYGVPLENPPWEDAFCGSVAMCLYAGMIDAHSAECGHHPTHQHSELDRKRACRRHAEWLISQLMMVKEVPGKPATMSFPSAEFLIAVVDVTDRESPRVELFEYDRAKTLSTSRPTVVPADDRHIEKSARSSRSHLRGVDMMAVGAFKVELSNVIRDHLERKRVQTEAALAAIAENDPSIIQEDADVVETAE